MDLRWICNGFAIDLRWICNGSEMELQWICNGFAMDLQWICDGSEMDQPCPRDPQYCTGLRPYHRALRAYRRTPGGWKCCGQSCYRAPPMPPHPLHCWLSRCGGVSPVHILSLVPTTGGANRSLSMVWRVRLGVLHEPLRPLVFQLSVRPFGPLVLGLRVYC